MLRVLPCDWVYVSNRQSMLRAGRLLVLLSNYALMAYQGSPVESSVQRHHHWSEDEPDENIARRQTRSLLGIVIILVLLISGLFLVQRLHRTALIEDCLLSGRRNCDALAVGQ